jgi:palmitoyltransferase
MAGTSLNLAALNLTQVERLGDKTKVYLLAVVKTSSDQPSSLTPLGEITYPLGAGFISNNHAPYRTRVANFDHDAQSPQDIYNSHEMKPSRGQAHDSSAQSPQNLQEAELPKKASTPQHEMSQDAEASITSAQQPIKNQESEKYALGEPPAESLLQPPGAAQEMTPLADPECQLLATSSGQNGRPREIFSARDMRATRTFAIVKMLQPGDNPWDLGSSRLNIETVMGAGILDWLLPIRRSPCCNHENPESQFKVGPKVAFLRASV